MTRDTTASFGVQATVVQNLTSESVVVSWWPEKHGEGRVLQPREKVRFHGNLFEAIYAQPPLRAAMEADIKAGKIAVALCGSPVESGKYPVVADQPHPGFQGYGCLRWEFNSSSSAWEGE